MPRWQYLTSFLLSRLAMLVIEVAAFLGFARLVFGDANGREEQSHENGDDRDDR